MAYKIELKRKISFSALRRGGYAMIFAALNPILQSEIGLADIGIRQQLVPTARKNDAAGFEHIAAARQRERVLGILLDQEHGYARGVDLFDHAEHFLDHERGKAERWLVEH